jgi:hypothetical protein
MFPRFETMWTYYGTETAIPTAAADLTLIKRNDIKGAYYTTNQWYNVEYPMLKIDMTPTQGTLADKRYRYFPGKVLNWSVGQFNEIAKNYNELVTSYNTSKELYEAYLLKVKTANALAAASPTAKAEVVTPVPQPNLPYTPDSYKLMTYLDSIKTPTVDTQAKMSTDYGGWGSHTMGLLKMQ